MEGVDRNTVDTGVAVERWIFSAEKSGGKDLKDLKGESEWSRKDKGGMGIEE